MAKFMGILHHPPSVFQNLSPEESQRVFGSFAAWMDKIRATGRFVGSEKLAEEGGKQLAKQKGRISVIDGPFVETKEVVGGFFVIRAESYEEALQLIGDCPFLDFGRIDLRRTDVAGCGGE